MASSPQRGRVYVGKYVGGKKPELPAGVRGVLIHTNPAYLGGDLSPYLLKDRKGRILENLWQFSKVYPRVYAQKQPKSRFHQGEIIWEHPAQTHFRDGEPTSAFWAWRRKGFYADYPIRYPNGFGGRHECLHAVPLHSREGKEYVPLGYIEARKAIYCKLYIKLTKGHPSLKKLSNLLESGKDLCIIEVDGPDVLHYRDSPIANSIEGQIMRMDKKTIKYLLEDPSKPFGHGFVIAALLLGGAAWLKS